MSSRDILKASRPKVVAVEISTGTVYVRGMNGRDRHQLMKASTDGSLSDVQIAALGVCEEDGAPAYAKPEEAAKDLEEMDGGDLQKIAAAVLRASGISTGEETEKN